MEQAYFSLNGYHFVALTIQRATVVSRVASNSAQCCLHDNLPSAIANEALLYKRSHEGIFSQLMRISYCNEARWTSGTGSASYGELPRGEKSCVCSLPALPNLLQCDSFSIERIYQCARSSSGQAGPNQGCMGPRDWPRYQSMHREQRSQQEV